IRFFLMMVWSLFIIGLMGLFFYNKIGSIIPMVVLPTTEIIEPKLPSFIREVVFDYVKTQH
ncbi:hypothetical protein, partial [Streptococcus infantis]|uniref:hypothetical protein n=1 Tax=Streptococcus infantis TaxID=68892 RepID=UPI0039C3B9BA